MYERHERRRRDTIVLEYRKNNNKHSVRREALPQIPSWSRWIISLWVCLFLCHRHLSEETSEVYPCFFCRRPHLTRTLMSPSFSVLFLRQGKMGTERKEPNRNVEKCLMISRLFDFIIHDDNFFFTKIWQVDRDSRSEKLPPSLEARRGKMSKKGKTRGKNVLSCG